MSSPSKKHTVENPKGNIRNKVITVRPKVDNVGSQSVKRKQLEIISHRKKAKAKRVKLSYEKVSSSLEVDKTGGVSSSSSVKVWIGLFLCFLFVCIIIFYLVTDSITISSILNFVEFSMSYI